MQSTNSKYASFQISTNNHTYTNKITTAKSLYELISEREEIQNFQLMYKGNQIKKTDNIKIPELGYEFGENFEFIELLDRNVSIELTIIFNQKEEKIFFEKLHINNVKTDYDIFKKILSQLHTSPNNIIDYSIKDSEIDQNVKIVTITLKEGYSFYNIELINATIPLWKSSKYFCVFEDNSTIFDLKQCIIADSSWKNSELIFYSDNANSFSEKATLNSINNKNLCFKRISNSDSSVEKQKSCDIFLANNLCCTIKIYEEYTFYQIAYLIEKSTFLNKNDIIFFVNSKAMDSNTKYQAISEINHLNASGSTKCNITIDITNKENRINVHILNQNHSDYSLNLPANATVSVLREHIIKKENCSPYFGLVFSGIYLENNDNIYKYFIDINSPIEITKITPDATKICDIYQFKIQKKSISKKKEREKTRKEKKEREKMKDEKKKDEKKKTTSEPKYEQYSLLLPINMQCEDVKKIYMNADPKSIIFEVNGNVCSDTDKMKQFNPQNTIISTKIPINCFYSLNNNNKLPIEMDSNSKVKSLLKKVSPRKLSRVQNLLFSSKLKPGETYNITTVDSIDIYFVDNENSATIDPRKCIKSSVNKSINHICNQFHINNSNNDIGLFSDFIELDKKENPLRCCPSIDTNAFYISSKNRDQKIYFVNPYNIKLEIDLKRDKNKIPIDLIVAFFGVPENKFSLKYQNHDVPLYFSPFAFPNKAVINILYDKNENEYEQRFVYKSTKYHIIHFEKNTTLLDMKKILQEKFEISDCSLNCISLKFGDSVIIDSKSDNNANLKKLLSDCYIYPLSYIQVHTPDSKNNKKYKVVEISTGKKKKSIYYFAKNDLIKDVRLLLDHQEGLPINTIHDESNGKQLQDGDQIPKSLIIKYMHYDVDYKGQKISVEYNLDVKNAENFIVDKLKLVKSDALEYHISYKRDFDNKASRVRRELKRHKQFVLLRYFKYINVIYEEKQIQINTVLDETNTVSMFKKVVRNNIHKPSRQILLSLSDTEITPIADDSLLGDIVKNDEPIYAFLTDSPILQKQQEQNKQEQKQKEQEQKQKQKEQKQKEQEQKQEQKQKEQKQKEQKQKEQEQKQERKQKEQEQKQERKQKEQEQKQKQKQNQQEQNQQEQNKQEQNQQLTISNDINQENQQNNEPNIIINESDITISCTDSIEMKNYKFRIDGDIVPLQFAPGDTILEARKKIAEYINEKNKDDIEIEDLDSDSIDILFAGKTLRKKIVIDSLNLGENGIFNVFVRKSEDILLMTAKALRFTQNDLAKAAEEEDEYYYDYEYED